MSPSWNFQKYLVGRDGQIVKTWDANTSVESIFDVVKAEVDGKTKKPENSQSSDSSSQEDKQEL